VLSTPLVYFVRGLINALPSLPASPACAVKAYAARRHAPVRTLLPRSHIALDLCGPLVAHHEWPY
jgi:hypothetical protein